MTKNWRSKMTIHTVSEAPSRHPVTTLIDRFAALLGDVGPPVRATS